MNNNYIRNKKSTFNEDDLEFQLGLKLKTLHYLIKYKH